jgi:hypothetical protein
MLSKKELSDAFEGRRSGKCLGTDLDAGGGIETLARSTLPPTDSGSEARVLRLPGEEPFPDAASRRGVVHDRELSVLTVRDSCSIPRRESVELCFFFSKRILSNGHPNDVMRQSKQGD